MKHGSMPMSHLSRSLRLLVVTVVVGCAPVVESVAPAGVTAGAAADPALVIQGLEARLLDEPLRLRFRVSSEGAFSAAIEGALRIMPDSAELIGDGTFGGAPVSLQLVTADDSVRVRSPQRSFSEPAPPALREALVIGLVRMGVLHNLARLTGGALPDHAEGGVREWVELREVRRDTAAGEAGTEALRFDIHVSGARMAEALLLVDTNTGLPVRREQVVSFPGGSMTVVEEYEVER